MFLEANLLLGKIEVKQVKSFFFNTDISKPPIFQCVKSISKRRIEYTAFLTF